MPYPLRVIRKDTILVKPVEQGVEDLDFTGITDISWVKLDVTNICDTGVYIIGGLDQRFPQHVDWEKLQFYRILIIRRGASKVPGRRWEMVERWYLHKINVDETIAAYGRSWKAQEDPEFIRPPRMYKWEKIR